MFAAQSEGPSKFSERAVSKKETTPAVVGSTGSIVIRTRVLGSSVSASLGRSTFPSKIASMDLIISHPRYYIGSHSITDLGAQRTANAKLSGVDRFVAHVRWSDLGDHLLSLMQHGARQGRLLARFI